MTILKRRKPPKMGIRQDDGRIHCPAHLAWVRGHNCAVGNALCQGPIEAAHVRTGTDGGTSLKPSDCWTIPLCSLHHAQQHQMGEGRFEWMHKADMKKIAQALWDISPHGKRYRAERP